MNRRDLTAMLGGAAAAWPLSGFAQQKSVPSIGALMLGAQSDPDTQLRLKAFREGLQALGWIEGRTIRIEYRWAANEESNVNRYATELVALEPGVILANGTPAVAALKRATSTIPIVCALVQDPVRLGFVASLPRPGGNITGFTYVDPELIEKWRELLAEIAPSARRAALLFNPTMNPQYYDYVRAMGPARLGVMDILATPTQTFEMLQSAMAELGRLGQGAAIIGPDSFVLAHSKAVAALAMQYRLPTISVYRQFAVEGGLLSHGPDVADIFRRSASYVDRILKGASPAELPVQQPDKFELVVNLKTARALGLTAPPLLLARADEVIE